MKINLLITFFITLFFLGCQSNIENETIKNIQSDNLPEKFFSVDSNLVVGIAQRLNRYTLISTKSIHQEKEIKNIVSYGKERSLPTLYIVNYEVKVLVLYLQTREFILSLVFLMKGSFLWIMLRKW